jgi:multidrug efflux pump subunit AcrB
MNVSAWSIRNPIPAVMLFVLLTFGGLLSFNAMKVQNFPDIDLPTVTVTASLPGAAPSQLETDVARKIENSIATIQGLKHITTKVQDGAVTLTSSSGSRSRCRKPWTTCARRCARARRPAGRPARPGGHQARPGGPAGAGLHHRVVAMDDEALSWFVDNDITRKLLRCPASARSTAWAVSRGRSAWRSTRKLQALGASAGRHLAPAAPGADRERGRPLRPGRQRAAGAHAGHGAVGGQMADMQIALSDGRRIRLDQVARISDTVAEPRAAALLNGKPVVGFEVARSRGESEVEVGARGAKALDDKRVQRPDIELTEAFDFVDAGGRGIRTARCTCCTKAPFLR